MTPEGADAVSGRKPQEDRDGSKNQSENPSSHPRERAVARPAGVIAESGEHVASVPNPEPPIGTRENDSYAVSSPGLSLHKSPKLFLSVALMRRLQAPAEFRYGPGGKRFQVGS